MRPIVAERGVNAEPTEDQYFKGALMLNTLRSVVNDDTKMVALLHGFYQHFKYQNIMTEDVVAYFNQHTGMNLTPIFNQYSAPRGHPALELMFGEAPGMVQYRGTPMKKTSRCRCAWARRTIGRSSIRRRSGSGCRRR